jgi:hypothetical protein
VLRVPPLSLPAYGIQVVVAFFLSGMLHAATLPRDMPSVSPLRYAAFFWVQGACVLVEAIVVKVSTRTKSKRSMPFWMISCLGVARLAWTVVILFYTLPVLFNELTKVLRMYGLRPVFLLSLPEN